MSKAIVLTIVVASLAGALIGWAWTTEPDVLGTLGLVQVSLRSSVLEWLGAGPLVRSEMDRGTLNLGAVLGLLIVPALRPAAGLFRGEAV